MKKTIAEYGRILIIGLLLSFIFAVPAQAWYSCPTCKYWSTSQNRCVIHPGTSCGQCKVCNGAGSCQYTCTGCESCEEGSYGFYHCEDDDDKCSGACNVCAAKNCYDTCPDMTCCTDAANPYCCDPSQCQTCDNGMCPVCGGDTSMSCCDGTCYDPFTEKCCNPPGDNNGYKCDSDQTCCDGDCCDPSQCCVDGQCINNGEECGSGIVCCDGACCECDCIGGECVRWTLETGLINAFDNCYCSGGNCGGEGHTVQYHSCKRGTPGSPGSKECVYEMNQPVGLDMDCVDVGNLCGILACHLLNAGVCYLQCSAAVSACTTCPGSWECSEALISCGECLTGEGIDCGCLEMHCVPTTEGAGTHYEGDNILQGGSCP